MLLPASSSPSCLVTSPSDEWDLGSEPHSAQRSISSAYEHANVDSSIKKPRPSLLPFPERLLERLVHTCCSTLSPPFSLESTPFGLPSPPKQLSRSQQPLVTSYLDPLAAFSPVHHSSLLEILSSLSFCDIKPWSPSPCPGPISLAVPP